MNRNSPMYMDYLCTLLIGRDGGIRMDEHTELLHILNECVFSPALVLDKNRVDDVYDILRVKYSPYDFSGNVSVLEVLMALCIRFCEEIGEDVWTWQDAFWNCLVNLGVYKYTNVYFDGHDATETRRYISGCVKRWLTRTYDYDGTGGCFPLEHPSEDQRLCDLWRQIGLYASEFMTRGGFFSEDIH